jgi:hypothetical protein
LRYIGGVEHSSLDHDVLKALAQFPERTPVHPRELATELGEAVQSVGGETPAAHQRRTRRETLGPATHPRSCLHDHRGRTRPPRARRRAAENREACCETVAPIRDREPRRRADAPRLLALIDSRQHNESSKRCTPHLPAAEKHDGDSFGWPPILLVP